MDIEVLEEKDNVFLKRKELRLKLKHLQASTPSKQELLKVLAEKYKVEPDFIIINYIFTKKGLGESEVKAKVYQERPRVKVKKGKAKEVKVEKKPKEEKQEVKEKPKEKREEGGKGETQASKEK